MTRNEAQDLLRVSLDDAEAQFRDGQWGAIDAIVNHRLKLLVVQRTGWGKSSVYFISTRIFRDRGAGLTVIISPLLALMRNQITGIVYVLTTRDADLVARRLGRHGVDARAYYAQQTMF